MTSNEGFKCENCHRFVPITEIMGTHNRNHCPFCLWSKHVDFEKSGDRASECKGMMVPVGLTFKNAGFDKWGKIKQGEIMVINRCQICDRISINRIAGDDNPEKIIEVFKESLNYDVQSKTALKGQNIQMLSEKDIEEIKRQLYGKNEEMAKEIDKK